MFSATYLFTSAMAACYCVLKHRTRIRDRYHSLQVSTDWRVSEVWPEDHWIRSRAVASTCEVICVL